MVSGSRFDGGTQVPSARVRKTIQSIKEIVGNHSDADIYVTLKESNMDPNETAQKLLNQDPFHEVKRKRGRKKENSGPNGSMELRKPVEHIGQGMESRKFQDRNAWRGGYSRNTLSGTSKEFRIVRDNRINQNTNIEIKPASHQSSSSAGEQVTSNVSERSSKVVSTDQMHSGARNSDGLKSSEPSSRPTDSRFRHVRDANSNGTHRKELLEETQATIINSHSRVQGTKASQSYSVSALNNSITGVYSSSSDPVHVPSPESRLSGTVGAIKRDVGVVGVRRQSSENSARNSSIPSSSFTTQLLGKDGSASTDSFQPSTAISKSDQLIRATRSESIMSSVSVNRPFLNNQYNSKSHQQLLGHQKAPQPNMEWKPKSSQKSGYIIPGVIGMPATPVSPVIDNSRDSKADAAHFDEKLSRMNIFENEHVIIPQHLRVPEADRSRLTFGSFGAGFDSTKSIASGFQEAGNAGKSNVEPYMSETVSAPDASGSNQIDLLSDQVRNSSSGSPASAVASGPLSDKEESSPRHSESYADIGLIENDSPSYTRAEPQQQQDSPGLTSFSAYDPQTGYDVPFFRPAVDENLRGHGLLSHQEALSSHAANSIPASTIAMVQQQPMAQMYPQVHVSHFANVMPYRQFLSPVYVPPMAMPSYSNNPGYPHPSNGSSYLLMPGGSSHLAANSLKYGTQQFKPVPAGGPTGFGNFNSPAGYAMNAPGAVGSATGIEDSTRVKYKEGNLYVPNPQAETSEIWVQNPRDLPGMQSGPYYNIPGQGPHAAYLPSHTGHASFNAAAAAAAAQSTHVQFPGLYHTPQPPAIANPHHMVPNIGGNVGVGVAAAAPGGQVGTYQQPQLGHLNWTTNF